jgi:hypothetical protein
MPWQSKNLRLARTVAAKAHCFGSFLRKECRSMRVHIDIDKKWLDGNVIVFVVTSLLIVIVFTY